MFPLFLFSDQCIFSFPSATLFWVVPIATHYVPSHSVPHPASCCSLPFSSLIYLATILIKIYKNHLLPVDLSPPTNLHDIVTNICLYCISILDLRAYNQKTTYSEIG